MSNILPKNLNVKRFQTPPTFPETSRDFKKAAGQAVHISKALEEAGYKKASTEIKDCHTCRDVHPCSSGEHFITAQVYTCKNPVCPKCALMRMQDRITEIEPYVLRSIKEGHKVFFLTCSIPNEQYLPSVLKKTKKHFSNLINSPWWKGKIIGGAYQIETTFNKKENTWHPHIHGVAIYEKGCWIDQPEFVERWLKITGDGRGFHVKRIHLDTARYKLREVLRYTVKPSEIPFDRFVELWRGIRKVRMFGRFGILNKNHRDFEAIQKQKRDKCICPKCEEKILTDITIRQIYKLNGTWEIKSITYNSPPSEITSVGTSKAKRKTAFAFP